VNDSGAIEVDTAGDVGEDKGLFTVPNLISAIRLACVPLFVVLLLVQHQRAAATWLLAGIGATDWVDGFIARRWHQVSTIGKVLDPVADRVALLVGVVAILVDGSAPLWLGIAALSREALISVGTLVVAALGADQKRIDVQWVGKAGTFGLFFAFPMFLAARADLGSPTVWRALAWTFAIPGIVLSWWALITYIPLARKALAARPPRGGAPA